jgi:DNA repair exonuclease SbcCD ATPase subunit
LEKTVASLALRAVIGRISCLSKPNFITFDEVLGKVAEENMENIKLIFDRIKDMYDIVFLITHIEKIKDWADNVIEIEKINNISKLNLNF